MDIILPKNSKLNFNDDLVRRAYIFAAVAHNGIKRLSGEDYITHPLAVAEILLKLGASREVIAAALLHDSVSDGNATYEKIESEFGRDIRTMVNGVEKLGGIKYRGSERHAESLRTFFVFIAKDVRIILIKLAERLHNMRTLSYVPAEKRHRIALETLEIYAPLANRLSIGELKSELEDLAFLHLHPKEYVQTTKARDARARTIKKHLVKLHHAVLKKLAASGIRNVSVDYREKHLWSLYKKLKQEPNHDINKIFDIVALRIITDTTDDCYKILGLIHSTWKPVPGRIKDYIATPKSNGYQSLHTTIFTGDGSVAEIQIRTKEMHANAEFGIASHLAYDESNKPKSGGKISRQTAWAENLIKETRKSNTDEIISEFFAEKIFVFTPKGEVVELPHGATPIDFAYAIHSSIGNRAGGAMINGKMSSLDKELKNNDLVEIVLKKQGTPHEKWLSFVKTAEAKRKIRSFLHKKT